jgi:thioredoxin-like negative regulator of GroEL
VSQPPHQPPHQSPITDEFSQVLGAMNAGRFRRAAELAQVARRKSPNDPRVLATLGQALARCGRAREALLPLRKAVSLDKASTTYRFELAYALDEAARPDEALAMIDELLELDPAHDRAVQVRCAIFRRTGRAAEGWAWLEPRLDGFPQTSAIALAAASMLPSEHPPEPVLARLRGAIAAQGTKPAERRSLFYALAKALDRLGQYDEAFAAAASANRLFPPLDLNQHAKLLDRMTPQILASIEPATLDASLVVLVCGMPRSGTTLTEQILAAHPNAATVGESPTLGSLVREALTHAETQGLVPAELSTKLAKGYLKHLRADGLPNGQSAQRVIDKMPQNLMYLGVVERLLPGCHVIRCTRDPRDIALSCYMQDFNIAHPYRSTFDSLADEILRHDAVAKRWSRETSLSIYESSLEKLTAAPEPGARAIVGSTGLEWDDACLRFHESAGHVKTASLDQIRSGINTKGHGRWKHYQRHLAPLIEQLKPILPE